MEHKVRFKPESSLAQQCYEQLQHEIIEGILKPGEKLKVDPLKVRFEIGQSPIREALSRLAAFGLVEIEDNKGFRVSSISQADIIDTYEIFTRIENMALALAIEHGDAEWEGRIVAELHKLSLLETKQKLISHASWAEQNYNFHVALIAGCKSPILLDIRRNIYIKFDRYCRIAYGLLSDNSVNHGDHKMLAEAVLARDVKKAQKLMTYHINGAREEVIQKFKDNNLI